jgi:TusA-related sulfurtransferase
MTEGAIPDGTELLYADGETCATLTPLIRAKMRELEAGSMLVVRTDDPSAREGITAWSRLTGNELVATVDEDSGHSRFYLRKK